MDNADFEKATESVTEHRNIKLLTTEKWSNYLASKPNYHITMCVGYRSQKKLKYTWMNQYTYVCQY